MFGRSACGIVVLMVVLCNEPSSGRPPLPVPNNMPLEQQDDNVENKVALLVENGDDDKGAIEGEHEQGLLRGEQQAPLLFKAREDNMDDKRADIDLPEEDQHVAVPVEMEQRKWPLKEQDDADQDEESDEEDKLGELNMDEDPLPVGDVLPPDHLEGVRMEQDGHLNRDYRKEVLIGRHDEFEDASENEQEKKLNDIYTLMDKNNDGKLTELEVSAWIQLKVREHFNQSKDETVRVFRHLDSNENGKVAWSEFHMHFLLARGYHPKEAAKHVVDYNAVELKSDVQDELIRYKFRWAEADEDPQDNELTLDEFQNFRHPESSPKMLTQLVQEILDNLDSNEDKIITEKEFIALPHGDIEDEYRESDRMWQDERRKEFRHVIDIDADGVLSLRELENYVDPKNPNHSRIEAENLISMADDNEDGVLSRKEVLDNMDVFLGSKVIDTARNFHDEF